MHTNSLSGILQLTVALIVIPAAVFDLRYRRVPNWLVLAGILMGVGLNTLLFRNAGLGASLKGIGLALLVYVPLYLLRGIGAGDVKLMAGLGAIVGPSNWLMIFVITAVLGGIAAIALASVRGRLRQSMHNIALILERLGAGRAPFENNPQLDVRCSQALRLPHALMIACGALAFLWAQNILVRR